MKYGTAFLTAFIMVSLAAADCVQDPTQDSCSNYTLPVAVVQQDLSSLCNMMKYMPGCTVMNLCASTPNDPNCDPFKTLKLICSGSMRGMSGCRAHYNSMCNQSISVVQQCSTSVLPIPEGSALIGNIVSLCDTHLMEGCNACGNTSGSCDTLTVYSQLCLQMPDMSQCSSWKTFCAAIPTWTICAGIPGKIQGVMKMYFHTGYFDYILFQEWVPQDALQYWLAILGIFLATVVYEILRSVRPVMIRSQPQGKTPETEGLLSEQNNNSFLAPLDMGREILRAFLRTVEVTLSYLLMLVVMTFNVGYFLALIAGAFVGAIIVGRFQFPNPSTYNAVNAEAGCH